MLVAISGSQGSGKTTTMNELDSDEMHTSNIFTSKYKTARNLLSDWNITLEEAYATPQSTIQFQDELLRRKFEYESVMSNNGTTVIVERSYADLFTYSLVYLGKSNRYSEWINEYYTKCMRYQQLYSMVFYLTAGFFDVQSDGVRGANTHYSRLIDIAMRDITHSITAPYRLTLIDNPQLSYRTARVKSILQTL